MRDFVFGLAAFSIGALAALVVWMQSDLVRAVVWYFLNRWGA